MKSLVLCLIVFLGTAVPAYIHAATPFVGKEFKPGPPVKQQPYHGNFKTMKYHNEFCDHYDCKTCIKIFKTKAAAEKAGYVPCGKCGG